MLCATRTIRVAPVAVWISWIRASSCAANHSMLPSGGPKFIVYTGPIPRRFLRRRGIGPVYTMNFGPPLGNIEWFAAQLDARIQEIHTATGATRMVLVAQSMGGLVARAYLRRAGAERVAA